MENKISVVSKKVFFKSVSKIKSPLYFDRLCPQQNSFLVPQLKLVQNNSSNPTLLVSEILEQNSLSQENMGINPGSENMNKNHTTSSLLPPPVRDSNQAIR